MDQTSETLRKAPAAAEAIPAAALRKVSRAAAAAENRTYDQNTDLQSAFFVARVLMVRVSGLGLSVRVWGLGFKG